MALLKMLATPPVMLFNESGGNCHHGHRCWRLPETMEWSICTTPTFSDDYNPLYRNDGDGHFTDISYQLGIADLPFLSWVGVLLSSTRTTTLEGPDCC